MSDPLIVHVSDGVLAQLRREAQAVGETPEGLASRTLEQRFGPGADAAPRPAEVRGGLFRRQFGNVDLGYPTGSDNESIDADLAREYADNHEEP
jgi:hypothetical protein